MPRRSMMNIQVLLCVFYSVQFVFSEDIFEDKACNASNLNSCGASTSQQCPSSTGCLNIAWIHFPPYAHLNSETKSLTGIVPAIFEKLLVKCCGNCWRVNLTQHSTFDDIVEGNGAGSTDIIFPFYLGSDEKQTDNMFFVPLLANPSVVYVTRRQSNSRLPRKLLDAVWNAWPVLVMALLLSFLAGILLWFLEFWSNREEFPTSFLKGSWEGFWWAFVSMTTVGYGDRAPKSIFGRAFAIFWILIGICICSIFTATLTTALTTITLEEVKTLSRAKVGAIRQSLESIIGVKNQAKVVHYNTTRELWDALFQDQVEGILLDAYLSSTSAVSAQIKSDNLKISDKVKCEGWSYGILVRNNISASCMNNAFQDANPNTVSELIAEKIESEEAEENEAARRSASIFDPTGDLFWPSLYVCFAVISIMLGSGLIWELVLMRKCVKKNTTEPSLPSSFSGNATNLDGMEKEMLLEVQRLFASWREKLKERRKDGPMGIVEVDG